MQYLAVQLYSTWLYNYTVPCCTIIQYLAVQLYSTWLYNYTVPDCTIIQYLTVQLYSTWLYNYTVPCCTIIHWLYNIPVQYLAEARADVGNIGPNYTRKRRGGEGGLGLI